MPIIEEWTAWFLVRERERELSRQVRLREAERERAEATAEGDVLRFHRRVQRPSERVPRRRRAA